MNFKATEELRGKLGKLKSMYGTGIKALDDITGELEGNSQSTFVDLNSEVSKHSSTVEDVSISLSFYLSIYLSPVFNPSLLFLTLSICFSSSKELLQKLML